MEAGVRGCRNSQKACWLRLWRVSSMSIATQQEYCRCKENHYRTHSQTSFYPQKHKTKTTPKAPKQPTTNQNIKQLDFTREGELFWEGPSALQFSPISAILRMPRGIQCCWDTEVKIDSRRDIVFCFAKRTVLSIRIVFAMKDRYSPSNLFSPLTLRRPTHCSCLYCIALEKLLLPSCSFLVSACKKSLNIGSVLS